MSRQASDDRRRRVIERLVDTPTHTVDLAELGYPGGAWVPSVEVWVNGCLRMPGLDYFSSPWTVMLTEGLLDGDTVRISALPDLSAPLGPPP